MKKNMTEIKDIIKEYKDIKLIDKIYMKLRWRLCPFNTIEEKTPKKGTILDLGCGYGMLANLLCLKSKQRKVIGMDLSSKRINTAKKSERKNKNLKFIEADITKYKLQKFDAIVMTDFLHHLKYEDQEDLISKLYEKLNKNGKLIILDIDKSIKLKHAFTVLLDRSLNYGEQVYYRTKYDMVSMLEKNKFKVIKTIRADKYLPMPDIIFIATRN